MFGHVSCMESNNQDKMSACQSPNHENYNSRLRCYIKSTSDKHSKSCVDFLKSQGICLMSVYYYHIIYMERDVDACIILGHGNSEVLTPIPFRSSASKHDMPNLKMKQNKTV